MSLGDAMKDVVHGATQQMIDHRQSSYHGKHRQKHWWNSDCLYNRDRQRFWYGLQGSNFVGQGALQFLPWKTFSS